MTRTWFDYDCRWWAVVREVRFSSSGTDGDYTGRIIRGPVRARSKKPSKRGRAFYHPTTLIERGLHLEVFTATENCRKAFKQMHAARVRHCGPVISNHVDPVPSIFYDEVVK